MSSSPALSPRVLRYGTDAPLPEARVLRAGPWRVTLENGALRYLTLALPAGDVDDVEVVRGIYVAVRDHNWATIAPRFTRYDVDERSDSFTVRLTVEHTEREIDFTWESTIEGTADGRLVYEMDGHARSTFRRNRIGFCVLHPMEAAGTRLEVEHPDGRSDSGVFPEAISPHQPFFDIVAMRQQVAPNAEVEVRFEGDVFEMEDQRNWTDASFKTYCTPLALPYPVEVKAEERVRQRVEIVVRAAGAGNKPPRHVSKATSATVAVGDQPMGVLPPIGLQVASHGQPLSTRDIDALRRLRLAHLRVNLDLTRPDWETRLHQASAEAHALGAALEIEAVCGDTGAGIDALAATLASKLPGARLARVLVFPRTGVVTTEPVMRRAREAFRAARLDVPLGGGTRADFVNANRAQLLVEQMDVFGYAINPQVHAFDNASLVETLAAQAVTVDNARRLVGGRPVAVGPVTLRQRLNPAASGPEPEPAPGQLPDRVDVRQMSLFGAGWTLGSIRRLASAGAASLTYFETTGWLGVMERTEGFAEHPAFPSFAGMLFPVYHVFAAIGVLLATGVPVEVLPVTTTPALAVEALVLRAGNQVLVMVANLTGANQQVKVTGCPLMGPEVRLMDEVADELMFRDHRGLRGPIAMGPVPELQLDLRPYAVAIIPGRAHPRG